MSWAPPGRPALPISFSAFWASSECALKVRFLESSRSQFPLLITPIARIGSALHSTLECLRSILEAHGSSVTDYCSALVEDFRNRVGHQRQRAETERRGRNLVWPKARIDGIEGGLIRLGREIFISTRGIVSPSPHETRSAGIEIQLTSKDGLITGIIDRADKDSRGILLVDYKSSTEPRPEKVDRARLQLSLYAFLWNDVHEVWPYKCIADFVAARQRYAFEVDPADCMQLADSVRAYAIGLSASNSGKAVEVATPGPSCKHCDFKPWCEPFWKNQSHPDDLRQIGVGFQGDIVDRRSSGDSSLATIRSASRLADVRFRTSQFPQLIECEQGTTCRVLHAEVAGSLGHPSLTLTESSEVFLVKGEVPGNG